MTGFEELGARAQFTGTDPVVISALFPNVPLVHSSDVVTALVDKIMGNAAHVALVYLSDVVASQVPVDQGELANSFRSDPATAIGGIELTGHTFIGEELVGRVFSALPYAAAMDAGRRPGAPVSREGIEAIGVWAERKLGLSAEEANRVRWAIAATIRAQGIPAHEYSEAALRLADSKLGEIFANAGDAIAAALAGSV